MTATQEFFTATNTVDQLKTDIITMIRARDDATPRHQQTALGPSEIGHPCARRLAYGLLQIERCNPSYDPLPAIIGTATHKWLESAASHANTVLGRKRWLVETRVNITTWLSGSCDLYDADTGTVIDYKVPGVTQFAVLRKQMSPTYRTQTHLYGKGFINAGLPVNTVAVMLIPRGGTLSSAHLWSEPYDNAVAEAAITRRDQTLCLTNDFDVETHPERFEWFAKSGPHCVFCPWFSPTPTTPFQCPGVEDRAPQLNTVTSGNNQTRKQQ